jgi:phosphoribosylamine--glycine ligase
MKVLVVGSGAREHALVYKISQSKLVKKIFCAPGNGGIADQAECVDIKADDIRGLLDFAKKENVDLTVVGPEAALVAGIVDEFSRNKLKIFGPVKSAAALESSKIFAKELMQRHNIATAGFKIFDNINEAKNYIYASKPPLVIKADGLAQGKGVFVCDSIEEAAQAAYSILQDRIFAESGKRIIIEDCLIGEEASILVFCDGKNIIPLASSQDHKRVFDSDKGPNTGGMGAYSPAPVVTEALFKQILDEVIKPTILGLNKEGINYQGVLYAGIMITKQGPKVLEFNVRFGDPETQTILPRLESDLVEVMLAVIEKKLDKIELKWKNQACVCVVCASKGYPGAYQNDEEIFGLQALKDMSDIMVFHSGTKRVTGPKEPARYFTSGGRVLGVTGLGLTIKAAIDKTYKAINKINFEGMHYRRDIGARAITNIK